MGESEAEDGGTKNVRGSAVEPLTSSAGGIGSKLYGIFGVSLEYVGVDEMG